MIKNLLNYSLLIYLNQLCNILINIFLIKYVSLSMLGDIAIAKVWMRLIEYSHLGLRFSIDRFCPVWSFRKNYLLVFITLFVSSIVTIIILLVSLIISDNKLFNSYFIMFGYVISVFTIIKNYYRSINNHLKMVVTFAIVPLIPSLVQIIILHAYGFEFYLYSYLFFFIICIFVLFFKYNMAVNNRVIFFSHNRLLLIFRETCSNSFILFLNSILLFFLFSLDKIFLSFYSSSATIGQYSIILFGFSLLLIIPNSISEFFFSKVISETVDSGKLFYFKEKLLSLFMTSLLVLVAYFITPLFFEIFLEEHYMLTDDFRMLLFGVLPYAILPILNQVLVARDKGFILIKCVVILIIFNLSVLSLVVFYTNDLLSYFVLVKTLMPYCNLLIYFIVILNLSKSENFSHEL